MKLPAHEALAVSASTAIQQGKVETLRELLTLHAGLATAWIVGSDGTSRTLLHVASDWPGHFPEGARTVAILVAAGANPNAAAIPADPRRAAETPLHWAASSDDVAVLDALLDGGASLESTGAVFTGGTALSNAVVFAQWRAARRLVERGAQTTLWQAAALGLLDRVQAHWTATPPTTDEVTNAFWNACRGGQLATAEFLLARGADLNWVGHDHKRPLQVARESGVEPLVLWLLGRGAR
jgi:ankyrin repeat protein